MRVRPRKLIAPGVLIALVALVAWGLSGRRVEVDVATIRRGAVRSFVEEEARTRAVERYVLSSPVAGRLLRVTVREDDPVKEGDVLARIDPLGLLVRVEETEAQLREIRARLGGVDRRRPKEGETKREALRVTLAEEALTVARRSLQEAEAACEKAERDAKRARELRETNTITPDELEEAELAETRAREDRHVRERQVRMAELSLEVAGIDAALLEESKRDLDWEETAYRAQVEGVEASLRALRDDLARAELTAPCDGVVLRRHEESETVVAAGAPILEVADVRRLEVEADLLSEDVTRMRVGQPVEVYGRSLGGRTIRGRIVRIHPGAFEKVSSLGVEQQRATVVAEFDPGDLELGDAYRVQLRVLFDEREDAVLAPEAALFRHDGGWAVFRVEGGRARVVTVETGLGDGRVREVVAGVRDGDVVVVHPDRALEPDTRVKARD